MVDDLPRFLKAHDAIIRVRITNVRGSTPRESGAEMLVAYDALCGTIGGGRLEHLAIARARQMIAAQEDTEQMQVALGTGIGQCCGGHVWLDFDRITEAQRNSLLREHRAACAARPTVYICGAGHVGRALAGFFAALPVRTLLLDSRAEELSLCDAKVEKCLTVLPEAEIRNAPSGSVFIVLTHDHALDFLLTSEALMRGDAAYVGLIGSATKRRRFEVFHQAHADSAQLEHLICPIGATDSTDKRPEVIAAFVVAEVMTALTRISEPARTVPQNV